MKRGIIFLASDHAGFETKERLKKFLHEKNADVIDLGPEKLIKNDDYPDYAFKLAEKVARSKETKGILVCGTGAGMTIAANKVRGIRAVEAYDVFTAKLARAHNDANVLSLSGWHISFDEIKKITLAFLEAKFSNEQRHIRRIKKISNYENRG